MTTSLQLEHRQELTAALRSGEYKQGEARLRTEADEFCCLGVACDLFDKSRWLGTDYRMSPDTDSSTDQSFQEWVSEKEGGQDMQGIEDFTVSQYPPDEVAEYFGFSGSIVTDLAQANDAGESFEKIADRIDGLE